MSELSPLPEVLYFGCESKSHIGHFLYVPGMRSAYRLENDLPEALRDWRLDGTFAPHLPDCKKRYCECVRGVEGRATLQVVDGWTVLAFWDRSADSRGASNSAFLVRGVHEFEDAVRRARDAFPTVWERFGFPVVPA